MKAPRTLDISRYDFAYEVLATTKQPSPTVFDIGCGDGGMRRVSELGYNWRGFDQQSWRLATEWDICKPCPVAEKAGAILLLDVLEHCVSPGLALQNIADALETGGRLVLTMPNPRWSAGRIGLFFSGYASGFSPADLDENHHLYPIWPHVTERLLNYAGLEVEDYVTLDGPSKLRLSHLPVDIARRIIESVDPSSRGMSFGLVARKSI